jgi:hypothetical protein
MRCKKGPKKDAIVGVKELQEASWGWCGTKQLLYGVVLVVVLCLNFLCAIVEDVHKPP